jgi:hypothetical protein
MIQKANSENDKQASDNNQGLNLPIIEITWNKEQGDPFDPRLHRLTFLLDFS